MKNAIRLTTAALFAAATAQAQTPITLTQSNFPATTSSVDIYQKANVAGVTKPQTGTNQTWNYSTLTPDGSSVQRTYIAPPANAAFATATRAYNYTNTFGPVTVAGVQYQAVTANGVQDLGYALALQRFKITAQTGGPNDSLIVPAQQVAYNNVYLTKFPKTAGSVETYSVRTVSQGIVTVQLLSLNRVPVRLVQRTTVTDSVAGWGTMRIPAASGTGTTAALPVLMRRFRYRTVDSVYFNNLPASPLQLLLLGIQQGQVTLGYYDQFSRANSSQPLASFYYLDKYQTLSAVEYSREAGLVAGTRPSLAAQVGGLSAYPNPTTSGQLIVATNSGQQLPVTLTVRDLIGREVAKASAVTGQASDVLRGLAAGAYLVDVQDKNGAHSTLKVSIQ
jgi:hypothetical protein